MVANPRPVIGIEWRPNGSGHKDLVVTCGNGVRICDSYYLSLDAGRINAEVEPVATSGAASSNQSSRIPHVLVRVLEQWLAAVSGADAQDELVLPFDFSDEHTGWIRCRFEPRDVELTIGWSDREGWSVRPTDFLEQIRAVVNFKPFKDCPSLVVYRPRLLATIRSNLWQFATMPDRL